MRKFLNRIFIFLIPSLIFVIAVIWLDFFKIFGFQDYYAKQNVSLNRGMITTSTFNHYRQKDKFDAFIFGSSRSQAFKCGHWVPYLEDDVNPFHFDAAGEGIWDISKKVEYIDDLGDTIKYALVILDRTLLQITYPRTGHLYIAMPSVSKSSTTDYYAAFFNAAFNPKFLLAYFDYAIFKTHRDYMGNLIKRNKHDYVVNSKTCDIWYGWDKEIELDSMDYYKKRRDQGVFYDRPTKNKFECPITPEESEQLKSISEIFKKHKTKYKIVISPIYDQIPLEKEQLTLLASLFGEENIYNFSGKNQFTDSIYNYYETSHYRPLLANKILSIIYDEN